MWIKPNWPAPTNVAAISTTRVGGVSLAPFDQLNLGLHVDDNPLAVEQNRQRVMQSCQLTQTPAWLNQIHSPTVLNLSQPLTETPDADGSFTRVLGLACVVMTADCLPVLLCNSEGTEVAAVHAGWRGLAGGVIDNAIAQFNSESEQIMAWLGPAIGPQAFEVGGEVREQFMAEDPQAHLAFVANPAAEGKWFADLYQLARQRLARHGVTQVYGGEYCTYQDPQFFSYRRAARTGRQASLIWLR